MRPATWPESAIAAFMSPPKYSAWGSPKSPNTLCSASTSALVRSVRNARKDANDFIKAAKADGLSEDLAKDGESEVQKLTDSYVKKIDDILAKKESDIMTV